MAKNVLGGDLEVYGTEPLTGFYRTARATAARRTGACTLTTRDASCSDVWACLST